MPLEESIHGRMANVFTGLLTGEAPRCEYCGFDSVIRHSYQDSWIQLLPIKRYQPIYTCTNNVLPLMRHIFLPKPIM